MKIKRMMFVLSLLAGALGSYADTIGVWGGSFSTWNSYLTTAGHTAVSLSSSSVAADFVGLDQVWLIRSTGDADLIDYVNNGGTLVTEWSAADWTVNTASLLDADVASLGYVGTGTPVSFTSAGTAIGLGNATGNPYANGTATEFFWSFTGLGSDVAVVATIPGYDVGIAGSYGSGHVLALGWDWQDVNAGNAATQNLVNDISHVDVQAIPEPSTIAFLGIFGSGIFAVRRIFLI